MPSPKLTKRVMLVIACLGLLLTIYLTYIHYKGINPVCSAGKACVRVQTSQWNNVAGVPVALIGLLGWIGIIAALLAPESEEARLSLLAMTVIGVGFSAYLTYREIWSIHAICEECATNAVLMVVMLLAAGYRYLAPGAIASPSAAPPSPPPKKSKSPVPS